MTILVDHPPYMDGVLLLKIAVYSWQELEMEEQMKKGT